MVHPGSVLFGDLVGGVDETFHLAVADIHHNILFVAPAVVFRGCLARFEQSTEGGDHWVQLLHLQPVAAPYPFDGLDTFVSANGLHARERLLTLLLRIPGLATVWELALDAGGTITMTAGSVGGAGAFQILAQEPLGAKRLRLPGNVRTNLYI